jgi:hypothetical protein
VTDTCGTCGEPRCPSGHCSCTQARERRCDRCFLIPGSVRVRGRRRVANARRSRDQRRSGRPGAAERRIGHGGAQLVRGGLIKGFGAHRPPLRARFAGFEAGFSAGVERVRVRREPRPVGRVEVEERRDAERTRPARVRVGDLAQPRDESDAAVPVGVGRRGVGCSFFGTPPPSGSPLSPSITPSDAASSDVLACTVDSPTWADSTPSSSGPSASGAGVLREGVLTLPLGYYGDLDSLCPDWGVDNLPGPEQDIVYSEIGFWRTDTGAQIARLPEGATSDYPTCAADTSYLIEPIAPTSIKPGARYCVRTNDGRSSAIKVVRVDPRSRTLSLEIRTWKSIQSTRSSRSDSAPYIVALVVLLLILGGGAQVSRGGRRPDDAPFRGKRDRHSGKQRSRTGRGAGRR